MPLLLLMLVCVAMMGRVWADAKYSVRCDSAFCRVLDDANKEISSLKLTIDDGSCVSEFGSKADEICMSAVERFSSEAPLPDDDKGNEAVYDKKVEDLEKTLDNFLHVLYLKQLQLLRDKAMKTFKSAMTTEGSEYEAMMAADDFFRREAEASTRQNPEWDYATESSSLKGALSEIASRARKVQETKLSAAKQTQQAVQYLQMQQQQLQAIQQQVQGQSSPWNIGAAYRVPDSNINLSCTYQQGRGNVQISCVRVLLYYCSSFLFLFVMSLSVSLLPIYYCLLALSDTARRLTITPPPSINHQSTQYSHTRCYLTGTRRGRAAARTKWLCEWGHAWQPRPVVQHQCVDMG
jgi:hypothetical protein